MTDRARLPDKLRREDSTLLALEEDDLRAQDGIMVRDLRTNERFWMHDAIIDEYGPLLGADTFTIYSSLCCMANREQYCWPSLARLARHWGKGKGTVVRAITLLTDLRLIHIKHTEREDGGNSNNIYYLLEPPPLDEGLMHLVTALRGRGASREQAVEQVLALLPQQWEPLRRKKSHPRTRADWLSLIEKHLPKEPSGPVLSLPSPRGSAEAPGGSAEEPGGSTAAPGRSTEERGRATTDWDGTGWEPGRSVPVPGHTLVGTSQVPLQHPKDQTQQPIPDNQIQEGNHHQGRGGVVLRTADEIHGYQLSDDEVLIELDEDGATAIRLYDLVRHDIESTARNWGLRVTTECFYSADQFLGLGGEQWMPEEVRKRAYHSALRRDLETLHAEIGACSVDEALARYFTGDLVTRFRSDDLDEVQRLRGWLRYVRSEQGKGLDNPAGFLRSRIESGQWPPLGPGRTRELAR